MVRSYPKLKTTQTKKRKEKIDSNKEQEAILKESKITEKCKTYVRVEF